MTDEERDEYGFSREDAFIARCYLTGWNDCMQLIMEMFGKGAPMKMIRKMKPDIPNVTMFREAEKEYLRMLDESKAEAVSEIMKP